MSTQGDAILQKIARLLDSNRIVENPFVQYGQYVRKIAEEGDITYVGYSLSGTLDDDETWVIKRLSVAGTVTSINFAINVKWTGYAGHTYI